MHLALLLLIVGLAFGGRWCFRSDWTRTMDLRHSVHFLSLQWQRTIVTLIVPPLLLLSGAIAILLMGHHGQMWGFPVGSLACFAAGIGILLTVGQGVRVVIQQWSMQQWFTDLPQIELPGVSANTIVYALDNPGLLAGQVGLTQSRIIVSKGLLEQLTPTQLQGVIAHEQAHYDYRDPLWFMGFTWFRYVSGWLPGTERLWQDLLLLRECRADAQAARQVDPLVLAETLVTVVRSAVAVPQVTLGYDWIAFDTLTPQDRLEFRVQSLIQADLEPGVTEAFQGLFRGLFWVRATLLLSLLPLGTIVFHHMGM